MAEVACIRVIWDRQDYWPMPVIRYTTPGPVNHAVKFAPIHFGPETGYPLGRKGAALAGAWKQLGAGGADGMLVLDADVAVDPAMVITMMGAIAGDPESVWTAPVRIWPVSTMRERWVWGHWEKEASQEIDQAANWFSFNFTYLPKALIEFVLRGNRLQTWTYPRVDASMARAARDTGIRGRVVEDCFPVHLHW
jgi:hypothetical protein